jgi:hypothetical protein
MSKYLHKASSIGLGLSVPMVLVADVARSQAKPAKTEANPPKTVGGIALPDPNAINKKIQQNYPPELLEDGNPNNVPTRQSESTSDNPDETSGAIPVNGQIGKGVGSANGTKAINNVMKSNGDNTTTLGNTNYTFVISTPVVIALAVIISGLALFPVVTLLLNSKKVATLRKSSLIKKFIARFQKPQVLESDKFLHQRTYEKLSQIANQAEDINADKFGNTEFMTFFKIKSYITRSIDEYANLDEVIELLRVAIEAQNSFSTIDSTESRYCSSGQRKLYDYVNSLMTQELDPAVFKQQIAQKLEEVLPLLKTEEGKIPLTAYVAEISKISENPLGLKLILLFRKYQLDDYSTLRSVSNTINLLESEDLLNLDALLLLVMVKYDVFEKLGPIVGIEEQHNRPETYSKMLQYIGLKSRHEVSYQKFQEFLLLLKQWETHYKTIVNVREKYSAKDYQLPKEFSSEPPGFGLYQKYKDSFHLLATPVAPPTIATTQAEKAAPEPPILTGVS